VWFDANDSGHTKANVLLFAGSAAKEDVKRSAGLFAEPSGRMKS